MSALVLKPRLSEKAYAQSQLLNTYVFEVPVGIGKLEVAKAVAEQFKVEVASVNILNVNGKVKRTIRRGGRSTTGKRADFKKAYVTLKDGDSLPIFAAEEEAEKAEAKAAKKGKK